MVSPHFPPDSSAGAHRVRLLAPHLPESGWDPTVVAVDPRDYETRLDPELAQLVPKDLRVIRCRAWSPRWTRRFGVGDLGLRALSGLERTCVALLRRERFDALFITIYPTYPAVLGPLLKRRFGVPFVLDYQDPWVGAWGRTVGGGPNGRPDLRSRLSRTLATQLEPRVVRAADAITAVSELTYEQVRLRYPGIRATPCTTIPVGAEPTDFAELQRCPRPNRHFDPKDGHVHVCSVGTLLPRGIETLRAVLRAVGVLRTRRPVLYGALRLHFFGTSNQTRMDAELRVVPIARELGVADRVTEIAPRIDYLDALTVQTQASALLLMGSSEPHYTASKLYPALLAGRPLLAVYHEASGVVEVLRGVPPSPRIRLVTYSEAKPAGSRVEAIVAALLAVLEAPAGEPAQPLTTTLGEYSARALAGRLAQVLTRVGRRS
jgi:glycosyltransferase involved in cell wall biosynthesis